jgi:hypothetical protein
MTRSLVHALIALACSVAPACEDARRPGGNGTPGTSTNRDASPPDASARDLGTSGAPDAGAEADAELADIEDAGFGAPDRPSSFDARPSPDATFPDAFVPTDLGVPDLGFADAATRDAGLPDAAARDAGDGGGDAGRIPSGPTLGIDRAELVAVGGELDVILQGHIDFSNTGPATTVLVLAAEARLNAFVGTTTVQQVTVSPSSFAVPSGPSRVAIAKVAGSPRFPAMNCLLPFVLLDVAITLSTGDQLTSLIPVNCPP